MKEVEVVGTDIRTLYTDLWSKEEEQVGPGFAINKSDPFLAAQDV